MLKKIISIILKENGQVRACMSMKFLVALAITRIEYILEKEKMVVK